MTVTEVCEWIRAEIIKEEEHLRSIGGATGMRNSQASAMGLARNSVRVEILEKLEENEIRREEGQG